MSRYRNLSTEAPYRVECNYGYTADAMNNIVRTVPNYYYNSDRAIAYYIDSGSFIDNILNPPLTQMVNWKGCDHQRRESSSMVPLGFTFNPPTPPLFTQPMVFLSPNIPTVPTLNWDSLIDDLASQVERGTSESFNLCVALAELRSTFTMMKNPLAVLKPGFRREIVGKTGAALKMLSSVWLTGRYGWKPFLSDVDSLARTLGQESSRSIPNLIQHFQSYSKTQSVVDVAYTDACPKAMWDTYASYPTGSVSSEVDFFYRIKNLTTSTKMRISAYAADPAIQYSNLVGRLLNRFGASLTWRNIRDVIWEVLPFSFVIDWFIDFSNAWRPLNESSLLRRTSDAVGYSVKIEVTGQPEILAFTPAPCRVANPSIWFGTRPNNTIVTQELPTMKASRYIRTQGLPASASSILKSKGLTLIHGIDGISLILQKAIRH